MLGSKAPTMMPTDCSVRCTPTTLASYILYYVKYIEVNIKLSTQKTRPKDFSFRRASHSRLMFILYKICTFKTAYKKLFTSYLSTLLGYALDLLVTVSSMCYHTSTSVLSTSSSSRGLTTFVGISHLEGGFTLRCLQRLSRPGLATLLCSWRNNRSTSGQSIPVLSY